MIRPEACLRCRRPMRPSKVSADAFPGTVQHHAHGRCNGCYNAYEQRTPRTPVYDVDVVAVDLAAHGERVPLNAAERYLAIHDLRRRGYSARETAMLLRISTRTVTRHRTRPTAPQILEDAA